MEDKFKIIDEDTLKLIESKMAKPDKTIKEHSEELLKALELLLKLGYIQKDKIYELTEKACVYHDLGKLNREFQKRVCGKNIKFNENKEVVHNVLSLYFIDSKNFDNMEDYLKVANGVLNHHNYCNNYNEISDKDELINSLLEEFKTFKVKRSTKSKLAAIVEDNEAIKIKGYLHKCDYCASSSSIAEYPNDFLDEALENLLNKWKMDNSESKWNELQKFCQDNKEENIIAIAQTGMGKTEAGLLWIGDTKGFFVLPIRTAINAIYDRVRIDLLGNKHIQERIAILHSSSMEYYIKNINDNNDDEEIDLMNYHKIGKQLAIPLNISTMDQLFDFVYKYPSYELKLTTLSYSKIVIDEIQAYGPDLLAYLICGLEKTAELGGKIAILTATLPPFIKDLLKVNIKFKENDKEFTNDLKRHNLKVIDDSINSHDIYEKYIKNKQSNKNNKILVVCNTINKAQELYEQLKELVEKDEINILHSKFIRKDRLEKEQVIIDFGRTYDENKNIDKQNGIWISTSIVEASLDIDFDYLFTELQELNSLFQRLGRCNRKGKKDSIEYNCYIYTEIESGNFIDGDRGFIDKKLYDLSKEAIKSCDGLISEQEKITLINTFLTTEKLKGSDYLRKYKEIYDYIKDVPPYEFKMDEIDLRNILSEEIIPSPVYEDFLEDIKEIEMKLQDRTLSTYDRIRLKDDMKKYTVSVHPNDVKNYEKAKRNGGAVFYNSVMLSQYKNDYIKVIECKYDDAGYKKIKYDKGTRDATIW
ncbi:CRISPR-associated helicase/endonuclease Cas3 [Clostridium butyricum]|jgi:CRISPR-associated endonuclease/helicase Cas3|uniref:CRISPR-associated helicase/endonuclease Cas3 n=1 Tax=Clostridium butyricum TaxID=1492 RepID=A0A512TNJ3_CLOBU|nr:CRISPR-associated helicase Cas3' [Clostridium butyricum]NOW25217.1 CRISPR-associated endonuclease/helicase Cas3 [Clostridium butyricum]RQN09190.1 CRISPR-associated helicase Cas3' [Clostridium butyricum]GEQ21840.1 CRISPR-associated helicase/endonuclease Cas3 [Clostridium butyricum]